jgi:hypothetical protein
MAWRWVLLALAMIWACGGVAAAAPKPAKKEAPAACKQSSDDDDKSDAKKSASNDDEDSDDDDDDEGIRFDLAGGCAKLTGGVSYTYQQAKKSASGLPVIVNRNGTVSGGTSSNSVSANIGLETTRQTNLGEFKTTVAAEWSKATDDGPRTAARALAAGASGLAA